MTDKPEYEGYFIFDSGGENGKIKIMMRRKPRLLTRLMAKWFFELGWRDL